MNLTKALIPKLSEPFPDIKEVWTGLKVPKLETENILWRMRLLKKAENDPILQDDLLAACKESQLFWINAFCWTYHQFETNPKTGKREEAKNPHWPFITWTIQDELFDAFEKSLQPPAEDILIDKSSFPPNPSCTIFCKVESRTSLILFSILEI